MWELYTKLKNSLVIVTACTVVQAVVKATSQSNGKDQVAVCQIETGNVI